MENLIVIEVIKNQKYKYDFRLCCNGDVIIEYLNIIKSRLNGILNKIKHEDILNNNINKIQYSYRTYRTPTKIYYNLKDFKESSSLFF